MKLFGRGSETKAPGKPVPSLSARIALAYFVFGVAWVICTDTLLMEPSAGFSPDVTELVEEIKGSLFVLVSACLIYLLVRRTLGRIEQRTGSLRESEERYRSVVDLCPAGVIVVVGDRIVYANRQMLHLLGAQDGAAVVGRSPAAFVADAGSSGRSDPAWHLAGGAVPGAAGPPALPMVQQWCRVDGSPIEVEVAVAPVRWTGQSAVQAVIRDLTADRRMQESLAASERRYRSLVESQQDLVVRCGPDGRLTFVNDTLCRVLGRSRQELIGAPWDGIVDPADAPDIRATVRAAFGPADTRTVLENRIVGATGARWYAWEGYAIVDQAGTPIELQAVGRDVTGRHEREQDLTAARAAAESANQTKVRFLATMSHELRTPLNAILGFLDLLDSQTFGPVGDPRYLEYAEYARVSGRHFLELVNDILDISKIEAGGLVLDRRRVPLPPVMQASFRLVHERLVTAGLVLEMQVPQDLPDAWADERALKQILTNLLSNAIKFTPAGGRIRLAAAAVPEGLEIVVADSGIGIPKDQIDRVLKPFEQVDNHYARTSEGSGLGLSIVLGLVNLHQGQLTIDDTEGGGTTVRVLFPSAAPETVQVPPATPARAPGA